MTSFDLVIASGIVIDGAEGAVPVETDVGVVGGRIVEVGDLSSHGRRSTLDAAGRVVAPGFIDTHTHVEMASLRGTADRFAPTQQGITTTLVGADGFGWVGLDPSERRRRWDDTAAVYGPPLRPLPAWDTPSDFLSALRAASPTDVIALIPQGNMRAVVMGDDPGPAGPGQRRAMRRWAEEWLDAGAVGLATGLDYLPGRFATTDELVEMCEVVRERVGVYASHLRLHDLGRAGAWEEIGDIGRRAGIPIRVAHERLDEEGAAHLEAASAGNDITFDTYLYPAGSTSLAFHVPADLLGDGVMALSERLRSDRGLASDLAGILTEKMTGNPGQQAILSATTSGAHEGRTLEELAIERDVTVGEVAVELMQAELPIALLVYVWQTADSSWDATVSRTLTDERSIIATDGVYLGSHPHPRGFGAFPRVLGELVRERGVTTLAAAIHKMTGKPAAAYGLADRGRIAPGLRADLVVFDPEEVAGPGDFRRPRIAPSGIDAVLVGGRDMHSNLDGS